MGDIIIFCVIPAFNEEKAIAGVIADVRPFVDRIILVDDGSADRTAAIAAAAGAVVLRHPVNRDQGAALETGDEYALRAGADIIVHFDADGQFSADEIRDVTGPIERGECDVVFGSRFLGKDSRMPFTKKHIIFPLARLFNLIFFGIKLTDPQSGFRALSASAAAKIVIENDGKAHCSEIIAKAFSYKLRSKEVPITVKYSEYGQKLGGGFRIIKDFFIGRLLK